MWAQIVFLYKDILVNLIRIPNMLRREGQMIHMMMNTSNTRLQNVQPVRSVHLKVLFMSIGKQHTCHLIVYDVYTDEFFCYLLHGFNQLNNLFLLNYNFLL